MQREDRNLHSESNRKRQEQPASSVGSKGCFFCDLHEIKGDVPKIALRENSGSDDAHQHERRAKHCVEKKLGCGVDALVVSPSANEEVHRDKHDLKEDEEQEQVKAQEAAHDSCFQKQEPSEITLFVMMRINSDNHEWEKDAGEHD